MRLVTDNITNIIVTRGLDGREIIEVSGSHGKVEIEMPKFGTQNAVMVTQVFQAVSEVTMATVETSLDRYFSKDFPNTHAIGVIR